MQTLSKPSNQWTFSIVQTYERDGTAYFVDGFGCEQPYIPRQDRLVFTINTPDGVREIDAFSASTTSQDLEACGIDVGPDWAFRTGVR